ncbi:hypothetical protein KC318_g3813 [Hortaea werneckii]|uniref:Uncharacterized protein n=1 Tax=Hortaea werneckii TaxID=91943 RepID=A0A3M7A9X8_HORWE|nr:hypothetical protein KC334_g3840 [Hortaea werneckii]KAI7016933.1 hypothetical protein KC355_g3823 [Hortaea werneckii]KAI7670861.1 hypothetical protein KC318_g3813 [Hortaea werneckii]RMY24376.1 hypothetical protein D0867_01423 [Hortaea werneckii]RMY34730.1 hypothetical protein D0866_05067 [Hortaea werneckii]
MSVNFDGGMWIWQSAELLASANEMADLMTASAAAQITDLYLYTPPGSYGDRKGQLQPFIANATAADIRVWALDGDRGYLDDAAGPTNFLQGIEDLIDYNQEVSANERFVGLQADIEPQDQGAYTTFHNGIPDDALSTAPGSGVWQSTESLDREMLMRNWLTIHQTASDLLHRQNLQFSAAMPFWTETYYGPPVQVNFPSSTDTRQSVMKYMMPLLDEYIVMSYNTDPANAANRVEAQATYASTLPAGKRPQVYAAMEVSPNVGETVSYGDSSGKNSKSVVLRDRARIEEILGGHEAFAGVAIHYWTTWRDMPE